MEGKILPGEVKTVRKERWQRLYETMELEGIGGVVLVPGPNLYYLTGLRMGLSERITLLAITASGEASFVMPELEASKGSRVSESLKEEGVDAKVRIYSYSDAQGPVEALREAFSETVCSLSPRELLWGLEYRGMRLLEFSRIKEAISDFPYVDAGRIFTKLRMIKDNAELEYMEKAASLCDLGVDVARRELRPGVTGVEVAREIDETLKARGAEAVGISLAIGPDTAVPHARTTGNAAQEGSLAWLDLTVCVGGYWGDITRTFAVGAISKELEEIYRVVLMAQEKARLHARVGMTGKEVDALAREVIESKGYGDYFIHRTGHGLGLEVHEDPYIVASNDEPLPEGSVFTVEPGIYLPGKGGVRIEDDIVLTQEGPRSLTLYPRNLLENETKLVV